MHYSGDQQPQLIIPDGQVIDPAKILDEFPAPRIYQRVESSEVGSCAWSPDGQYFAWSCGHRIVKVVAWKQYKNWKSESCKRGNSGSSLNPPHVILIDAGENVRCLAFGHLKRNFTQPGLLRFLMNGNLMLATGLSNGRIRTWDPKTGSLQFELVDHERSVTDLSFSTEGTLRLLSASLEGNLKVWDMEDDGNLIKTLWTKSKSVFGCCWSPSAKMIASVGDYKSVLLWDMDSFTIIRSLVGHQHNVCKCCFSPDGSMLATSSFDSRVIIWDVEGGIPLRNLHHLLPPPSPIFAGGANGCYVRCVVFSQDGGHLGTVCDDNFVRFWDLSYSDLPEQAAHVEGALSCQFSPDGSVLAVGTIHGKGVMLSSPFGIPSLQHFSRLTIRRCLPLSSIDSLDMLPQRIRQYLKFDFV